MNNKINIYINIPNSYNLFNNPNLNNPKIKFDIWAPLGYYKLSSRRLYYYIKIFR